MGFYTQMRHKDLSAHMNRGVAKAIPNSPEAGAILAESGIRPLTFGDLLTRMGEAELFSFDSIDDAFQCVHELLGLSILEFNDALDDNSVIPAHLQSKWIESLRVKLREQVKETKMQEMELYFSDSIYNELAGSFISRNPEKLTELVEDQCEKVTELETRFQDPLASPRDRVRAYLDLQKERPRSIKMSLSRYAISLPNLLVLLKKDEVLPDRDEEFKVSVVEWFADNLQGSGIWHDSRAVVEFFTEAEVNWDIDQVHDFNEVYLTETDVVELLAKASYETILYDKDDEESRDLWKPRHPLLDILRISDEEREAFFQKYPLATPPKDYQ